MSVLIFILILSFLVIIHELGHFIAARRAGMKIEEFGLGYPPLAIKLFKWKETWFTLNWIPFGGFVRIEGEEEAGGAFHNFSIIKRLQVMLAGVVVNFIFGVLAFGTIFSISGIPTPLEQPRISEVAPGSPAAMAGIPVDVNILGLKINEQLELVENTAEVIALIAQNFGQTVTIVTTGKCDQLTCQEMAQEFEVYLRTQDEIPEGQGSLGVVFEPVTYLHYPWWEMPFRGIWYGLVQAFWLGGMILQGLGDLLANLATLGHIPQEIAGPIGIVHQASSAGIFSEGILSILGFTGMLSINLAILNALPIPALDGGRVIFLFLEKILGRRKIEKIEHYANYGGYFLLLSLIILVTIRDVVKIFS